MLSTNGLLFAKRGLAILPTSVRLHISIDSGFAEVHEASRVRRNLLPSIGSLEQVMSMTAHAVHAGYRVRVLTCIGRHNFRQLIELGERLAIAGVNEWNISRVLAAGRAGFGNCGQWEVSAPHLSLFHECCNHLLCVVDRWKQVLGTKRQS